MEENKILVKYKRRLVCEGWINSLICAAICAFFVITVVAFSLWLAGEKDSLYVVSFGVGSFVVCAVLCYFLKFRTSEKLLAKRVDELGLQERIVTAEELSADKSFIASVQREDAEKNLAKTYEEGKKTPFLFVGGGKTGIVAAILLGISAITCVASVCVFGLAKSGVLPSGSEVINGETDKNKVVVSYLEEDGGTISGEAIQIIEQGGTTTTVTAVPEEGWVFVEWSDGYADPERQDVNVTEDFTVFAIFEEAEQESGDGGGNEPSDEEPTDESPDTDPSDPDGPKEVEDWQNNTVLDGTTKYKDVYEAYSAKIKEYLANGENIPEELRAFIETYNALLS